MKILQINNVYNFGSTGKITKDIHYGLMERGHESVVIYGRRNKTTDTNVYKLCPEWYAKLNNLRSRIDGIMYGGCFFSTSAIIKRIEKENPDVVHLQCLNGFFCNIFRLLTYLKKKNIPTVLTLHAEFMYTANCGHAGRCMQWTEGCIKCENLKKQTNSYFFDKTNYSWKKIHKIFENWDNLTVAACSDWIKSRAEKSGNLKDKNIVTVHNGVDNELFFPVLSDEKIRKKYNIPQENKIVLYAAPAFSYEKGFDLLLDIVNRCRNLPFTFLLAGDNYISDDKNVVVAGAVWDQTALAELYSAADVLVMCSRNENYPTVCLEANSCGTYVAAYDVGGVKETICHGMGRCVPFAQADKMKKLLTELTASKPAEKDVATARKYHSKDRMTDEYIRLYEGAIANG